MAKLLQASGFHVVRRENASFYFAALVHFIRVTLSP